MSQSYWGYWLILLGIFVIVIMLLISNVTTTNTQDYYLIKEVTEASLVDSVDLGYYRQSGELRINKERFVEDFVRRFAENVALSEYQVDFYGLYEAPPKVSVKVTTKSATYNIAASDTTFDITNKLDAILELDGVTLSSGKQFNGNEYSNIISENGNGSSGSGSSSNNGSSGSGSSSNNGSGGSGSSSNNGSSGSGSSSNNGSGGSGSSSNNGSSGSGSSSNNGSGGSSWSYGNEYDDYFDYDDDIYFNYDDDIGSDGSENLPSSSELRRMIAALSKSRLLDEGFCYKSNSGKEANDYDELFDASKDLYEQTWGRNLNNLEESALSLAVDELYSKGYFNAVCQ